MSVVVGFCFGVVVGLVILGVICWNEWKDGGGR